ncbi:MAG: hypothetical protein EHM67_12910 [Hyphomicrobiaceae bacterium]|nr:MAG: hypothetical protein EHM67_12910 [Hyphomicrobiaceae bacterium]
MFAEDLASNLPFVGGAIDRSRTRAVNEYSRAEVNKALSHINASTKQTGEDAVTEARQIISNAYERNKANVFLSPQSASQALNQAEQDLQNFAQLDPRHVQIVGDYIQRRISPHIRSGQPIDGPVWKDIDTELGQMAQRARSSSDPMVQPLGDAYKAIQNRLRDALEGKVAGAVQGIEKTNAARRALYPIEDASEKAVGKMGRFNPTQMAQAAIRAEQHAGDLNRQGRELLTDRKPLGRTLSRLGIGGGAAPVVGTLAHLAGASPVIAAGATAAATAGAGVAANALYNPATLKFILHGLSMSPRVPRSVPERIALLPASQQAQAIQALAESNPSFAQAVAQLGRAYASQQGATQ